MKATSLLLILVALASCKDSSSVSTMAKHSSFSLTRYRRTQVNMPPIIVSHVSTSASKEKVKPLSGTFFLDGQRQAFYEATRADNYVLSVLPGVHRLQLVTVTYYTAEASFRIKPGDSLRIDFQLRPDQRPLY